MKGSPFEKNLDLSKTKDQSGMDYDPSKIDLDSLKMDKDSS